VDGTPGAVPDVAPVAADPISGQSEPR
jgi:hypothetical protein